MFFILQLKERNLRDQQMPKPAKVRVIVLFLYSNFCDVMVGCHRTIDQVHLYQVIPVVSVAWHVTQTGNNSVKKNVRD